MRVTDERARELIDDEIRLAVLFEGAGCTGSCVTGRHGGRPVARLDRRTVDRACRTFAEAITVLEETDATLQLAHAHAVWVGHGRLSPASAPSARTHLVIGLDLAHRCGALGLETELRQELLAAGASTATAPSVKPDSSH